MAELQKRERASLADMFDWFQEGLPGLAPWRAMPTLHGLRVEDYVAEGRYVVRVELPGIDPDRDVEVTVADGALTIRAERREERKDVSRSEFRYGSFERRVTLPPGAREDDGNASYTNGILAVSVGIAETAREPRRVPIARASQT